MQETGLTLQQAQDLLKEHGRNELPEQPPPSNFVLMLNQLKSPLVYILIAAAVVTMFLHDYTDAIVIGVAILINTVLGFIQEKRAGQALKALKDLIHPETKVIRDDEMMTIDVAELVPGDLVILNVGDKVPADGKLIYANRLFITEALLTGESVPVGKNKEDPLYMGTVVTAGQGKFIVEKTGSSTEMGKIAQSLDEIDDDTPLRRQLTKFSKQLSVLVIALTTAIFLTGMILGLDLRVIFTTSVALAVAAIPEGLLVGLTVVLAIGMQRILSHKGLVRNLVSAETLGGVTTICVDKTGTLTQGKMQVVDVMGDEERLKMQTVLANDLDDPVVIAAYEWGSQKRNYKEEDYERLDSIPFDSKNKFFASLHRFDENNNLLLVNGAPEILIERAKLGKEQKDQLYGQIEILSSQGKRIIGYAQKHVSTEMDKLKVEDIDGDLEWVGMIGFSDPIRHDVAEAFEKTEHAGIKLVVITGDYSKTAISILEQMNIHVSDENIILGPELEKMDEDVLAERLFRNDDIKLFARTKPEQKLKIVQALKSNEEVVAMMGDGVNDAPAITAADIGIVVGEATDVAKESADLVLLDSSFNTIVLAIEEGRGIFDNLRKMILFLMSDAFVEILLVFGSIIAAALFIKDLPLPITAAQILWVNLVSDGFPSLALTIDPKGAGIMNRGPRPASEPLVSSWMKKIIAIVSAAGALLAFILFYVTWKNTQDIVLARSVAFATVGTNSSIYVFSIKGLQQPFWKVKIFNNKWLNLGVLMSIIMQLLPFTIPFLMKAFETTWLGNYWYPVIGASFAVFILIEILKWVFRPAYEKPLD